MMISFCLIFSQIQPGITYKYPVDKGRKLNVHKTFRGRPGRLLNVLCTFYLRPVSTGNVAYIKKNAYMQRSLMCSTVPDDFFFFFAFPMYFLLHLQSNW